MYGTIYSKDRERFVIQEKIDWCWHGFETDDSRDWKFYGNIPTLEHAIRFLNGEEVEVYT